MKKLIGKYFNGNCNPEEFQRIVKTFETDSNNLELNSAMIQHIEGFSAENAEAKNIVLLDRIHHQIALTENNSGKYRERRLLLWGRFAAAVIIGLLMLSTFTITRLYKFKDQAIAHNISTPQGAKTNLILPDGTQVWLNSSSQITYSGDFVNERNIKLTGEAYFDVVKSKVPFEIKTQLGNIKVLGTAFNVKAYPDENFVTTLERGSLEVSSNSGNRKVVIKPGQQSTITNKMKFSVAEVDSKEFVSWKDGKLIFIRKPLKDVVKMLERWYNLRIVLENENTQELWFTGTIEMETITEVLEMINTTLPIEYAFDRDTRIMKIKAK